ncbi:hypothetical protein NJC38_14185 [Pseudomonas sp. 21LCFQ010]|uniref:hypothetical protein n=1 Tax=Pseudomonas sp. 21LCFQ010 TaxID=2957506 RepID=UPI0020983B43|nr:hypothetical protein [Pseudomonas sp. 21LCFQ010]MCO8163309.1 hypothetical protein [Pseudomonas sp. 21LCFQ010]
MTSVNNLPNAAIATYGRMGAANQVSTGNGKQTTSQAEVAGQPSQTTDQATFSSTAVQMSQTTNAASGQFPGRPGMSTSALVMATGNPGLVSSSKDLTFPQVASDARARLDAKYAQMQAGGAPYDANSYEGRDTHSLLGDLDRRSLYAVSSNKDGLFTKAEQTAAANAMGRQVGIAMGLYDSNAAAAFGADPAKSYKAGLDFLNNVSPEEKNSAGWLEQHIKLEEALTSVAKEKKPDVQKTLFDIIAEMYAEQAEDEQAEPPPGGASDSASSATPTSASTSTNKTQSSGA